MITLDEVKKLVRAHGAASPTVAACAHALELEGAVALSPVSGGDLARRLLRDLKVRAVTAAPAGAPPAGLAAVLDGLAAVPGDEHVSLAHFGTDGETFSVFVRNVGEEVLGCVVLPRRGRPDPPPG